MHTVPSSSLLLPALLLAVSCAPPVNAPPEGTARFTVHDPASTRLRPWLDIPWPSDVDRAPDGTLRLDTFPNPTQSSVIEDYRLEMEKLSGWGLNGGFFLGFTVDLAPASLPADEAATLDATAAVQLVDVDPASPELGRRIPLRLAFRTGEDLFLPAHTLVALPVLGFPLRPSTSYALVVLDSVRGSAGGRVEATADLHALLSSSSVTEPRLERAWAAWAPLRSSAVAVQLDLARVVHATVITTQDPYASLQKARERVVAGAPYVVGNWSRPQDFDAYAAFHVYEGTIGLPHFQQGIPPYDTYDGHNGGFVLDETGTPVVQRTETVRFALTVPRSPPPAAGRCVVVVAHGTGGDFRSFIGSRTGDESTWMGTAGCAAVSISQPLHRTRDGYRAGSEELATFNFLNPQAGTGNWRQSALESIAQLHSISTLVVPAGIAADGTELHFRDDLKLFFGHSQGGITGAIMTGVETDLDLAILSGAGGGFAESILEKTEPVVLAAAIRVLLGLPDEETLDEFHPLLTLLQSLGEVLEPLNAAPRYYAPGRKPPNVLIYSGLLDEYTPPRTHGPLAAAAGIPVVEPVYQAVPPEVLRGLAAVSSPVTGDMSVDVVAATAGLVQWPNNGHFAVYENSAATGTAQEFLRSLVDTGVAQIVR
ncbi:MAG: hypothetical protein HY904_21270 [Deltaproteobacteria bacterium]|nr:hypothetical protein [Deltaproteobacteria bacterium]